MNQKNHLLTISEVSRRLNVPKHTLRFWEKEFDGLFIPLRTQGGQRRFTPEHLAVIEQIKRQKERGMNLSEIKRDFSSVTPEGSSEKENRIDQLARRVAEAVKIEVFQFLEFERRDP
ncbi:MAG TPA: MerR family transcriptional regulator [Syntrophales bacterium]|nr:MerR family transcriptional regulator [Syntrophales bacterium]